MNAVKLLNLTVLELFVNNMAILTRVWGHMLNSTGRGSEGYFVTCAMGMDSYHVLAKCVLLDNIEQIPVGCKGEVNDMENNPGPAVFNNTNLTTTVSAGHNSRN